MNPPRFSILIPSAGRSKLVTLALTSVADQSLHDWEAVVADSGNSGETERVVKNFGDPRIRYIHVPDNDPSLGWDVAAKAARGQYLLWLDDDNYLLPFALKLFDSAIERSRAEIITASHLYYYSHDYPRHFLRNSLGVVPFSQQEYPVYPREALRQFFAFTPRGPGQAAPRFHPAATVVARKVVERAIQRLGFAIHPHLRTNHSYHPILLTFATSGLFIDRPVVIVGRFGTSLTQVWSTEERKSTRPREPMLTHTPVNGHTRTNMILESFLRVQRLLPEMLATVPINFERFAELYLAELSYLDTDVKTAVKNWKNFFAFVETLHEPTRSRLQTEAKKRLVAVPLVLASRRLGLHIWWRSLYGAIMRRREAKIPPRQRFRTNREFFIPLAGQYDVNSAAALAQHHDHILRNEVGYEPLSEV